jgi:hypothetical protein
MLPKNDIVRRRGDCPGEAGADWSYGATAKPEADEHYVAEQGAGGLAGHDKRQGDLHDQTNQTSSMREPVSGEPVPPAGPHAKPELTDKEKTPGAGTLPEPDEPETFPGTG